MLKDVVQGQNSPTFYSSTSGIDFNNHFYFVLNDGLTGAELWRTDGLSLEQVSDIEPGAYGSSPNSLTSIGNNLYFSASQNGVRELYKYDGSELSKIQNDINGYSSLPRTNLFSIEEHLGDIFFSATDENFDTELWKYDGTNVSKVYDLNPEGSSNPRSITSFGSELVFCAESEETGRELFKYDGNEITLLKDIRKGEKDAYARELTVVNDKLFFIASDTIRNDEIWQYNGTSISKCGDVNPYGSGALGDLVKVGDLLVFHGANASHGDEVWSYNGNKFSIHETNLSGSGQINNLSVVDNQLYYDASTGDLGSQLWKLEFTDQVGEPTNYSCAPAPVVTSTKDDQENSYFNVYPNPSHGDDLHISLKDGGTALIHVDLENVNGEILLDETSNLEEVNTDLSSVLSHVKKGVYILHVDSGSHHYSEKLVIN